MYVYGFVYIVCLSTLCKLVYYTHVHISMYTCITQYGSTVYIGIAMVFVFPPYIREIQFLLSVSTQFDF